MADDYSANTSTTGIVGLGGSSTGSLESGADVDWFKFTVFDSAPFFRFDVRGIKTGGGTLADPLLRVYNSVGGLVFTDDDDGFGLNSRLNVGLGVGTYYLAVSSADVQPGTYTVSASVDDYGEGGGTFVSIGTSRTGSLEAAGDVDVFSMYLHAGVAYDFSLSGSDGGGGTLLDPYLQIDEFGGNPDGMTPIVQDDDSGAGRDSRITHFVAATTGSYYIAVREFGDNAAGTYTLIATASRGSRTPSFHVVDFDRSGTDDVLFRSASGALSTWTFGSSGTVTGGGAIGNPGAAYRVVGTGDFNGDNYTDILFRNLDGTFATWDMTGTAITGGGTLGNPGVAWSVAGTADYNIDGKTDILFYNGVTGAYATWDMNDITKAGGGNIGTPGAAWAYKATADFNHDGAGDILFQNVNGTYALWSLIDTAIVSSGNIGDPGPGWFFKGTGDFNGDGNADILFENANGTYATWDLNGTVIIGGGSLGAGPAGYTFAGIGDYNGDGGSDIMFTRASDGAKYVWFLDDLTKTTQFLIGSPGSGLLQESGHGTSGFGTIVFQDSASSTVASWLTGVSSIVGGGTFGQPGAAFTALATGDFMGTGETDVLFRNTDGSLATWTTNGTSLLGGGTIGTPGSGYAFAAAADFNGDGRTDILFQNTTTTGAYALWDMTGTTISGGGTIGTAAGYAFAATGDINGDGRSDIIFRDANGGYAAWTMNDTKITGGGFIGNPTGGGVGWTLEGTGDFNGDGKADMLFQSTSGIYATWDLNGTQIIGGGTLGDPGGTFQVAKILDINGDGRSDVLFVDSTGHYASWLINDTVIIGGGALGTLGGGYHVV